MAAIISEDYLYACYNWYSSAVARPLPHEGWARHSLLRQPPQNNKAGAYLQGKANGSKGSAQNKQLREELTAKELQLARTL